MTWHYARKQRSVFQAFDPLGRLREAAAAREAAGLRRRLVPRSPRSACCAPTPGCRAGRGGRASG